jgi:hypothetical protein
MLLLASACATPGAIPPPAADLKAVIEPKPVPSDEIATSQKAADLFSAEIEAWGDRISAAGARLCRWTERTHKVRLDCPKAKEPDDGR